MKITYIIIEHKHLKHTSMIGTVNNGTLNPWKNFYGQDFPTYYRYKLYLCMVLYNIIINIPRGYIGFVTIIQMIMTDTHYVFPKMI